MAGGYSSDDSYEEITPKQSRSLKKEQKNSSKNSSPNTQISGKHAKDKIVPDPNSFSIPEILCECQQKCTERITPPLIQKVCMYFKGLPNRNRQYSYLSTLIQIKVKHITGTEKTTKGKPFRKMGFRYFVPILTADDMKHQIEERKLNEEKDKSGEDNKQANNIKANSRGKQSDNILNKASEFPDWDHIEVCLSAFTTIHLISEKRVTITRATRGLQTVMKCSKPFVGYIQANNNNNTVHPPIKKKIRLEDISHTIGKNGKKKVTADICSLAAEWLAQEAAKEAARDAAKVASEPAPSFAIDPETYLPSGLVLPASVTCLPVFPRGPPPPLPPASPPPPRDHNKDLDIVDNFFSDQLWKPEYIGVP